MLPVKSKLGEPDVNKKVGVPPRSSSSREERGGDSMGRDGLSLTTKYLTSSPLYEDMAPVLLCLINRDVTETSCLKTPRH